MREETGGTTERFGNMWILLVLAYGLIKGAREIVKKKALTKSTVMEVLFLYTLLSFLMIVPEAGRSIGNPPDKLWLIVIKSFIIFCAWILSFKAIKKMPISFYGVLDLSRVLFATLLGLLVLHEKMGGWQIVGLVLVSAGLLLLPMGGRFQKTPEKKEHVPAHYVVLAIGSCMLNACSGLLDKILMRDNTLSSGELQFWYMLFLVGFYTIYMVVSRTKMNWRTSLKNYWIWILSILFVLADRALFIANALADSKVTVMTLIKQSGCLVTILGGKFFFKEKNIEYKLLCAVIIIIGIVVAVL